jgi:hypothetical protein
VCTKGHTYWNSVHASLDQIRCRQTEGVPNQRPKSSTPSSL